MSASPHGVPAPDRVIPADEPVTGARLPRQRRSHASLERMLGAAEQLMIERSSEDFTLHEVAKVGDVSIGSIYLRFEGKNDLIRAVIAREFEILDAQEDDMLVKAIGRSASLEQFMPAYVEAYAELLRHHAPLLRLIMLRAARDPLVSGPGSARGQRAREMSTTAILRYRHEIGGADPELKAASAFNVIFATLARNLSLGQAGKSEIGQDWQSLKTELGRMTLAYLRSDM
jgi:AcrR family transcriptional regulator